MAYTNLAIATKTSRAAAINTAIGASGSLLIYSGVQPSTPDTAATGTLLVTLPLSATAATAASGVLTFNSIAQTNATATGTAGWARFATSGGAGIIDCDVATSGATVTINTTSIVTGGPVVVSSAVFTEA